MGFRGRSGGRGRGRGRGEFRGRGRGSRGRGGRGGFTNSRIADNEDLSSLGEESEAESEVVASESENETPATTSYSALLQILKQDGPSTKKRRLNTNEVQPTEQNDEEHNSEDSEQESEKEESSEEMESDVKVGSDGENILKDIDFVDEKEEDLNTAFADEVYDDSDEEDAENPFDSHFCLPEESSIAPKVIQAKANNWTIKRSATNISRVVTTYLEGSDAPTATKLSGPGVLKLKPKLREVALSKFPNFNLGQSEFAPHLFNYRDILYCQQTVQNAEGLRNLVCLHALNHIFKTRDRVIKNNQRLSQKKEDTELECRDQGFTRPKVLFIVPTRQSCVRIIDTIVALSQPDQQENRKRFDEGYIDKDSKFGDDKPADFKYLFEGNDDDMFRIGVKFTRKTIKYFAQFYNSDILIASPLGLRMAIGSEDDKKKKLDYDFLSSIELVVLDQASGLLMQNWEHVEQIFENLNKQPKDAHGCDFSRVRSWYLEDWARYFRQTVVLSAFNTPELAELMRIYCHNIFGKLRIQPEYHGILQQLGVKTRQTFVRFDPKSVDKDPEARFEYFKSTIVPLLVKRAKDATGTLIFIPSYLDFVRIRNFLANDGSIASLTFGTISEYADVPEASRARSHFLNGRHRVLLYTERAHHFRRYRIRGVQKVIMYAPPDNPLFYKEITGDYFVRSEQDQKLVPGTATVRVMFSKYDAFRLERIVGSARVGKMLNDRGDTFDFV